MMRTMMVAMMMRRKVMMMMSWMVTMIVFAVAQPDFSAQKRA